LAELENLITDRDLIAIAESNRVMNSPLVQESTVAAAKIDQPKFANVLQMYQRMPARHFRRLYHYRVSVGASERTTAFYPMASAICCFQPGTFLWGHVHADASYQIESPTQTGFRNPAAADRLPGQRPVGLSFFSIAIAGNFSAWLIRVILRRNESAPRKFFPGKSSRDQGEQSLPELRNRNSSGLA